ncbi:hypothetical protein OAC89_03450 [Deltaproteobacteria bacterium]|nr:hypothetical protein [Deltaproteobacteria bacterium]
MEEQSVDKPPVITDAEIRAFLETYPLYKWATYSRPQINRGALLIQEIEANCGVCGSLKPFHDLRYQRTEPFMPKGVENGSTYFEFTCVTCRKSKVVISIQQTIDDHHIRMQKYGELPRKKLPRDKNLQKFFTNDLECFEKAVVCEANGYGIAAFIYLRRIVENNIQVLLSLIEEEVKAVGDDRDVLSALAELRETSRMSEKIKVANNALPKYLRPDGLNPLGTLYKVLSEGLHAFSDDECLHRAIIVRESVAFLVAELSSRKSTRVKFKKGIESLNG